MFRIEIETSNAAFVELPSEELADILDKLALRLARRPHAAGWRASSRRQRQRRRHVELHGGRVVMFPNEKVANETAQFLPMTDGGETERPCLVVGGVQVYAYFNEGRLVVSVHVDTGDVHPEFLDGDELPYEFTVNGEERDGMGTPLGRPEKEAFVR